MRLLGQVIAGVTLVAAMWWLVWNDPAAVRWRDRRRARRVHPSSRRLRARAARRARVRARLTNCPGCTGRALPRRGDCGRCGGAGAVYASAGWVDRG